MVWQVLEMLAAGEKVNDILKSYPSLTKEMIEEALSYAAEILKGEHAKSP
jgi:uncharacterized protein (DUF433 family)